MVFFLLLLYCVKTTPKSIIMRKARVLFVSQEITPYLDESHIGKIARRLPQAIQERGKEIRTFMPKYGNINERRHQFYNFLNQILKLWYYLILFLKESPL